MGGPLWRPDSLEEFYRYMAVLHPATGLMAKIPLLALLLAVLLGNRRPASELLLATIAVHFFIAWYLAHGQLWTAITAVKYISFILMCVCAWTIWSKRPEWRILPEEEPWRWLAGAGYILAFLYPFWDFDNVFSASVFSLMGVLPHQTLLVLLLLVAVGGKSSPRFLGWCTVGAAVALALVDLIAAGRISSLILMGGACVAGVRIASIPGSWMPFAVGDAPPEDWPEEDSGDEERKPKARSGRKWDLR